MSKTIKVKFKPLNEFHNEVLEGMKALDKGHQQLPESDPTDIVLFDSMATFQSFFTAQKIEILAIIKHVAPKTIYELTSLTERQFPAVLKDVKSLASYGFLELKENNDSRKSLCPKLSFDYDEVVVEIPIRGYRISLEAA
ncbi:MAG: hypothetical protein KA436_11675 [Oligoflexales bacterium]|nr:hypothetical protein [Oligoflexales bacterium]